MSGLTANGRGLDRGSFITDLGFRYVASSNEIRGEMELTPELLVPGHDIPRVSVMATVGDVLVGQLASAVTPTIPLTTDLSIHLLRPMGTGRLRMEGRLVKIGQTLIAGEASWWDGHDETVAYCWATFMVSRWAKDGLLDRQDDGPDPGSACEVTMSVPFADALGIRTGANGVAKVDRHPYVLQPTGTLQGGVVCALGEVAAGSVLAAPVTSLETHFLAGIRAGAGRATAVLIGDEMARVQVVDTERPDRVAAVIRARAGALNVA